MTHTFRELDRRLHDRVDVRLLWRAHDDRVIVVVADEKSGEHFSVDVRDDESAVDVFQHPFAYAAWHRVEIARIERSRELVPECSRSLPSNGGTRA